MKDLLWFVPIVSVLGGMMWADKDFRKEMTTLLASLGVGLLAMGVLVCTVIGIGKLLS